MKVKGKIDGEVLGVQSQKYGEKETHRLKLLQGMDSVGVSVPNDKLVEAAQLQKGMMVTILVEFNDYRDKTGFYMRYESFVKK
jgi:hypothetical protein